MSDIVLHRPVRENGRFVGQVDFTVHGWPVSIAVAVPEEAVRQLRRSGELMLARHGISFAGKACCKPCERSGKRCSPKVGGSRPIFGYRMPGDAEEVRRSLEINSELEDAIGELQERLPPEVALYQEVMLAAADPYRQDEVERWFYQLRLNVSRQDPLALEAYQSLEEVARLDQLQKRYFDNDLIARWQVESLESEALWDPEAERLWGLFGALGAVSTLPLTATYDITEGLTTPEASVRFGKALVKEAKTAGLRRTIDGLVRKAKRAWRTW